MDEWKHDRRRVSVTTRAEKKNRRKGGRGSGQMGTSEMRGWGTLAAKRCVAMVE